LAQAGAMCSTHFFVKKGVQYITFSRWFPRD
jgi:hypothetical protein